MSVLLGLQGGGGDPGLQPLLGAGALQSAARRFACVSVLASALLWNAPRDTSGPLATQPDTAIQPIAGTSEYSQAMAAFTARSRVASLFLWTAPQDPPPSIVVNPALQEIAGLSAHRQAGIVYRTRVGAMTALTWTAAQDGSGPLAVQPDPYVPPLEGTAELAQALRSLQARSRAQSSLAWAIPADPPILDPYVQDVVGLSSIRKASAAYRSRVVGSAATIWTTAQDSSGPLGQQPDTFIQPIEGQLELRQAIAAWRTRAVASSWLWAIAQDQPQPPASDPAIQEIAGLSALSQRARASRVAVGVSHALAWTLPRDQNGPLATQPDTAIAPIEGVTALASAQRAWRGRIQASLSTWTVPNDAIAVATVDTVPVVIEGQTSLQRSRFAYRTRVVTSAALVWTASRDSSGPLGPQPDTYIQPVSGTSSVRQSATWRARVQAALPLIQTTAQDRSGPLSVQPDTYVPPIELSMFARRQATARLRAAIAQSGAQTFAADQNGPQQTLIRFTNAALLAARVTNVVGYRPTVLRDQPLAYWRLNDAGVTMTDLVGGHDGTITGDVATQQPGVTADGDTAILVTNDSGGVDPASRVEAADFSALNGTSTISLEAWFRIGPASFDPASAMVLLSFDNADNNPLLGGTQNLGVVWTPASGPVPAHWWVFGEVVLTLSDASVGTAAADTQVTADGPMGPLAGLETGQRVHVVFTFDGTLGILYVNGVRVSSDVPFPTPGSATLLHGDRVWLGSQISPNDGSGWTGLIDEVAIYPAVLTAADVAAHYAAANDTETTGAATLETAHFTAERLTSAAFEG